MEWKLFADLAETAGGREVTVDVAVDNDARETVGDALEALLEAHPDLRSRVMDGDELASHVNVLHNGRDIRNLDGMDTELEGDDELALFPPVSGG